MSDMYKIVSLFSGCGGLDLGLIGGFDFLNRHYKKNPFEIILANDINKKATMTQRHNFKNNNIICQDVRVLVEQSLPRADVLVGGFPCQDFSLAGKQKGFESERGNLYKALVTAVTKIKPKIFIAENVKGLLLWNDGLAIQTILKDFADCGYNVEYKLFNVADYGVPQVRERVIIVGIHQDLKTKIEWSKPTHSKSSILGLQKWVSAQQAIGDLECEKNAQKLTNNQYSGAKKNKGQGNKIIDANKPAPTIRAEHHGNIEFHYKLPRRLSAREAARLQSFPDNFEFLQSTTDAYRQIGNAVPPVFAWHIAQSVLQVLIKSEDMFKNELKECI
jgi:DNA (cytosine-5)-methyltransferase 1